MGWIASIVLNYILMNIIQETGQQWHELLLLFLLLITVIAIAGCFVGGGTISDTERIDNDGYDSDIDHVPLSIPPKDIPLSLLSASHAELLWLHIWNHLVGNCSQLDSLLCCITCKSSSLFFPYNPASLLFIYLFIYFTTTSIFLIDLLPEYISQPKLQIFK